MAESKEYDLLIKNVRMVRPLRDSRADADIALIDPGETWIAHAEESESRQGYTPFEGLELGARVKTTFLRVRRIYDNGEVIGEFSGRFLRRPY